MSSSEHAHFVKQTSPSGSEELSKQPVMNALVLSYQDPVLGHIIERPSSTNAVEGICWLCNNNARPRDLFKPCPCDVVCHRDCFRKWREGWINPRNYFCCPTCMFSY